MATNQKVPPGTVVCTRLDAEQMADLRHLEEMYGKTTAQILRNAVVAYLAASHVAVFGPTTPTPATFAGATGLYQKRDAT